MIRALAGAVQDFAPNSKLSEQVILTNYLIK
jgi:hypothetical protein